MAISNIVAYLLLSIQYVASFTGARTISSFPPRHSRTQLSMADLDPEIAMQFKIVTCTSPACCKKREVLGLSEYDTYSAFYSRIKEGDAPNVQIEEVPCLGNCKMAPVVAVQHEDFEGTVGLIGMTDNEMNRRVFHNVFSEEDYDRIWSAVENGIQMMAEEEDYDD